MSEAMEELKEVAAMDMLVVRGMHQVLEKMAAELSAQAKKNREAILERRTQQAA